MNNPDSSKIFLVADQMTVWGYGKTLEDAISKASQWVCGYDGKQGVSIEYIKNSIITQYDSQMGIPGFYIIEYNCKWPTNADEMDGFDWFQHYYEYCQLSSLVA